MINIVTINFTPPFKQWWRWTQEHILNWLHKRDLKLYSEAIKSGQVAALRTLGEFSLIEDWPLAIEARISLSLERGKPRVTKHPNGVGLLMELTRWDLKEQGDVAYLVARKVECKQWVKKEIRGNTVAKDALAWALLDTLQKGNEALARVIAPKFPIEFRKDVEPSTRNIADRLIALINGTLRGPGSSVEGLSAQEAVAFRHRFQIIVRLGTSG